MTTRPKAYGHITQARRDSARIWQITARYDAAFLAYRVAAPFLEPLQAAPSNDAIDTGSERILEPPCRLRWCGIGGVSYRVFAAQFTNAQELADYLARPVP